MDNRVRTHLLLVGIILCLISLLLPWWSMSASTQKGGYDGHSVGYGVDASANLYSMTGGIGFCRSVGEDDYKIAIASEGTEYWFGWITLALIGSGIILSIAGNNKSKIRNTSLVLILIGILFYPLGLELSLNSNWLIGNQQPRSNFQVLNALAGNFGNTHIGLFSSGIGSQQSPAFTYRGALFFPDTPLYYTSYLTYGFFTVLAGEIIMAIALKKR